MNQKFENEIKIIQKYFHYLYNQDKILNQISSFKVLHGGGHRYEVKGKFSQSPLKEISTIISYSNDDIIEFKLEELCQKIYEMIIERLNQMQRLLYSEIINSTELTGNKVETKESAISGDLILDLMEKIEICFDKDDNPIIPELHTSPELFNKLKNLEITEAQLNRKSKIIEEKRKKWYAKKRYRKLSFID